MLDFQKIPRVENYKLYLETAFAAARKKGSQVKVAGRPEPFDKQKQVNAQKIGTVGGRLHSSLGKVLHAFPSIDSLPVFHRELIRAMLDWGQLKKSLGAIDWVLNKITFFQSTYSRKIKDSRNGSQLSQHMNEFYGRISSIVKQINPELSYLENARKSFRQFPVIRENLKNVVIIGFPNVGKSTLMSKLTISTPEIEAYPFTTKNINVAYIKTDSGDIQLLDVPGALNRGTKMNVIEMQAFLALKYLADAVVYVFDLTEQYPLSDQIKLYNQVREERKDIIVYISKSDILDADEINSFQIKGETNVLKLKEKIISFVQSQPSLQSSLQSQKS